MLRTAIATIARYETRKMMTPAFSNVSPELCLDTSDDEIRVPPTIARIKASKIGM